MYLKSMVVMMELNLLSFFFEIVFGLFCIMLGTGIDEKYMVLFLKNFFFYEKDRCV